MGTQQPAASLAGCGPAFHNFLLGAPVPAAACVALDPWVSGIEATEKVSPLPQQAGPTSEGNVVFQSTRKPASPQAPIPLRPPTFSVMVRLPSGMGTFTCKPGVLCLSTAGSLLM